MCRTRRPKGELLRLVRTRDGTVAVDPPGTAPGRGAYVCRSDPCARGVMRKGGVARALGVSLPPSDLDTLRKEIQREIE